MQMGNALGTAHAELRPQTREHIEHRMLQLRHLVGEQYIDSQLDAGRKLQNQYAVRNRNDAAARAIMSMRMGPRFGGSAPGGSRRPHPMPRRALSEAAADAGRMGLDTGFAPG